MPAAHERAGVAGPRSKRLPQGTALHSSLAATIRRHRSNFDPARVDMDIMPLMTWLLTFTCYGTWLPGDPRGFVRRGDGVRAPSLPLRRWHALRLPQDVITLDDDRRMVVDAALAEACRIAGWTLHAAQARTNHVHAVVTAGAPPPHVMTHLKGWSTRRLREAGLLREGWRTWSRGGSARMLRSDDALVRACRYVVEGQG
jgi:REP element-mobilizing transposase RayT